MTTQYTRHRSTASIDAAHRAYHSNAPDVTARTAETNTAGTLMLVATMASMVIFILSVYALQGVYGWYPPLVAQQWFIYDQLLTAFSFVGLIFSALATAIILSKKSFRVAVSLGMICTLSGASAFVVTLIQPDAVLWSSILYYFLPLFIIPLAGTILTYLQGTPHSSL